MKTNIARRTDFLDTHPKKEKRIGFRAYAFFVLSEAVNPFGNVAQDFLGNRFLDVGVLGCGTRFRVLEKVVEAWVNFEFLILKVDG